MLTKKDKDRIIFFQGMVGLFRRLTWSEAALLEDDGSHEGGLLGVRQELVSVPACLCVARIGVYIAQLAVG